MSLFFVMHVVVVALLVVTDHIMWSINVILRLLKAVDFVVDVVAKLNSTSN